MAVVSVVIRTYNEARYLDELLSKVRQQQIAEHTLEIVVVDSGSTDDTLAIAEKHHCVLVHIEKQNFTFGRSLNVGIAAAQGDYLAFVSGHCVPVDDRWLMGLTAPLTSKHAAYTYGNQMGRDNTKFSERQVFEKYFDPDKRVSQAPYFVNNANAALAREAWDGHKFDEDLTGLEDMHLAQRLLAAGYKVAYADDAAVYHIHDETWRQVKWRYEREAIALQKIDPSLHMSRRDLARCIVSSILLDSGAAIEQSIFWRELWSIVAFRVNQYWGSYTGSRSSRRMNEDMKRRYFYPNRV